jgi:beta-hydroxyacyl-ACP dehydratase FabZ
METKVNLFDIQEVLKYLPHRYPFLLVDRVVEFEENRRIVGLKNVTFNEPFFQGHFPGVPIMPGVLILESMAQVGGFLVFKSEKERHKKLVFLSGVENARFRRPVRPGDQLEVEMVVLKVKSRLGKLQGTAYVDGQMVAEATVLFSMVTLEDYQAGSSGNE